MWLIRLMFNALPDTSLCIYQALDRHKKDTGLSPCVWRYFCAIISGAATLTVLSIKLKTFRVLQKLLWIWNRKGTWSSKTRANKRILLLRLKNMCNQGNFCSGNWKYVQSKLLSFLRSNQFTVWHMCHKSQPITSGVFMSFILFQILYFSIAFVLCCYFWEFFFVIFISVVNFEYGRVSSHSSLAHVYIQPCVCEYFETYNIQPHTRWGHFVVQ